MAPEAQSSMWEQEPAGVAEHPPVAEESGSAMVAESFGSSGCGLESSDTWDNASKGGTGPSQAMEGTGFGPPWGKDAWSGMGQAFGPLGCMGKGKYGPPLSSIGRKDSTGKGSYFLSNSVEAANGSGKASWDGSAHSPVSAEEAWLGLGKSAVDSSHTSAGKDPPSDHGVEMPTPTTDHLMRALETALALAGATGLENLEEGRPNMGGFADAHSGYGPVRNEPDAELRASPYPCSAGTPVQESAEHANLFIGNLPVHIDEAELTAIFSTCGNVVSVRVSVDPTTGRSKGSGFVRFSTREEAQLAIAALDSKGGMVVKFADSDVGKGGGRGKGMGKDNLYISGLPGSQIDATVLRQMFSDMGMSIVRMKVIPDTRGTGTCAAMVQLASAEQAAQAITMLHGTGRMTVTYAAERERQYLGSFQPNSITVRYAGFEQTPSDNLYVVGLPSPQVDEESLRTLFRSQGLTITRMRTIPDTRSKGFSAAMVQVASQQEAAIAIAAFTGLPPLELGLVASANLQDLHPETIPVHGNLFVGHLPAGVNELDLHRFFGKFGTVASCKVCKDTATGRSKGSGFVKFTTPEEALKAISALNGKDGLLVKFADSDFMGKGFGKGTPAPIVVAPLASTEPLLQVRHAEEQDGVDMLHIAGLPSPEVDPASLLTLCMTLGLKVGRISPIADNWGAGSSAAHVEFASKEEAHRALEALHGKRPSDLGVALSPNALVLAAATALGHSVSTTTRPMAAKPAVAKVVPARVNVVNVKPPGKPVVIPPTKQPGFDAWNERHNSQGDGGNTWSGSPEVLNDADHAWGEGSGPWRGSQEDWADTNKSWGQSNSTWKGNQETLSSTHKPWGEGSTTGKRSHELLRPTLTTRAEGNSTWKGSQELQSLARSSWGEGSKAWKGSQETPRDAHNTWGKGRDFWGGNSPQNDASNQNSGGQLVVKYKGGDGATPSDHIFISGLPPTRQEAEWEVYSKLSGAGLVVKWRKIYEDRSGWGGSSALVQLESKEAAAAAIAALSTP